MATISVPTVKAARAIPEASKLQPVPAMAKADVYHQWAIRAALKEKEENDQAILEAEERNEALDRVIALSRMALTAYTNGVMPSGDSKLDSFTAENFDGLTIKQILMRLAMENQGILKGRDAVRTIMRVGLIHDRKSADSQVYTVLRREKEFQRIRAGEYRLMTETMNGNGSGPKESKHNDIDDFNSEVATCLEQAMGI